MIQSCENFVIDEQTDKQTFDKHFMLKWLTNIKQPTS